VGLLDRLIGAAEKVAPEWALRREHARQRRAIIQDFGYGEHGASRHKKSMAGWLTQTGGPDADIVVNAPLLRERSRDLAMGDPIATGALKTIRTNEIGVGLRLNSKIDAEYLNLTDDQALLWEANVEREFRLWASTPSCDAARRFNFGEIQELARLSQLMSGDVFALLPAIERAGERYDLRIKLLEADRVCDPFPYPVGRNVLGGVEVDGDGAPVAYYVAQVHPGDALVPFGFGSLPFGGAAPVPVPFFGPTAAASLINKWDRVESFGASGRRLVLHLMEAERPDQRRGVPLLAPVMEQLKQLSRYTHAELMAAVVSGFFTAAITSERSAVGLGGPTIPSTDVIPQQQDDRSVQLGNGAVVQLLPGEKMEAIDPSRPNAGFEPFVRAVCQQIGAGIGLPYEVLLKQFTSSYSASRGALLEAWKTFVVGRGRLISRFCQPVYEQWLEEAVARGYISAPGFFTDAAVRAAWCGAEWYGPTQGQLDPVKEVQAAEMRVASGFSTRARETAELTGGNWEQMNKIREREERLRREAKVIMAPTPQSPDEPQSTQEAVA
jgi:capsid protein